MSYSSYAYLLSHLHGRVASLINVLGILDVAITFDGLGRISSRLIVRKQIQHYLIHSAKPSAHTPWDQLPGHEDLTT
jgi:hypothetical protein